jgi:hypothetical protein
MVVGDHVGSSSSKGKKKVKKKDRKKIEGVYVDHDNKDLILDT